jgi:type III secretory pathway component EscU
MRKAAIVLLVLLILLMVLPMVISMAMTGACPVGSPACTAGVALCSLMVGFAALLVVSIVSYIRPRSQPARLLLLVRPLERPPRV